MNLPMRKSIDAASKRDAANNNLVDRWFVVLFLVGGAIGLLVSLMLLAALAMGLVWIYQHI